MANNKEAYYFPHFSVARNDRKIRRLRKQLGVEGYGIYFMLLEVLREQTDLSYPMDDLDLLADEFNTSEEKILVVIKGYDLFQLHENNFFSPKLIEYLQPYFEKSSRARNAALKRWDKETDANAMQMHSKCNANKTNQNKTNQSKGEQNKTLSAKAERVDFDFFLNEWNQVYGTKLKLTQSKRTQIKQRLKTFSQEEILQAMHKRRHDYWLNHDGAKHLSSWDAFWRNDEKVEKYLNAPLSAIQQSTTKTFESYADQQARISRQTEQDILSGELSF